MPIRSFDTAFWSDPDIEPLSKEARYLFIFLWTNPLCNTAGLYEISLDRISRETKIPVADLPALFAELKKQVKWFSENNLVWVKNFIKHQSHSPKFIVGAARCLKNMNYPQVITELLSYNLIKHTISIPLEAVAISSLPCPDPVSYHDPDKGVGEGGLGGTKSAEPGSDNAVEDTAVPGKDNAGGAVPAPVAQVGADPIEQDPNLTAVVLCYEQNIGLITPIIAEELRDIVKTYPFEWFPDAVREAINNGARKLSYIKRILERWAVEGKGNGTKKTDRDKYIKGKYGHLVQR
jgi:DnaD/phage-associated family protein